MFFSETSLKPVWVFSSTSLCWPSSNLHITVKFPSIHRQSHLSQCDTQTVERIDLSFMLLDKSVKQHKVDRQLLLGLPQKSCFTNIQRDGCTFISLKLQMWALNCLFLYSILQFRSLSLLSGPVFSFFFMSCLDFIVLF